MDRDYPSKLFDEIGIEENRQAKKCALTKSSGRFFCRFLIAGLLLAGILQIYFFSNSFKAAAAGPILGSIVNAFL